MKSGRDAHHVRIGCAFRLHDTAGDAVAPRLIVDKPVRYNLSGEEKVHRTD